MPIRRLLIVAKGKLLDPTALALQYNTAEIAEGIPPSLKGRYTEADLPIVHIELIPASVKPLSPLELVEDLEKRVRKVLPNLAERV
ncbi:MAG: hypothetical protein Q7N50_04040 [Armatimonadota bacterium]|nr:hypothetical protein [Armatimonadota bacterium]